VRWLQLGQLELGTCQLDFAKNQRNPKTLGYSIYCRRGVALANPFGWLFFGILCERLFLVSWGMRLDDLSPEKWWITDVS
jgi:hypothetical protein